MAEICQVEARRGCAKNPDRSEQGQHALETDARVPATGAWRADTTPPDRLRSFRAGADNSPNRRGGGIPRRPMDETCLVNPFSGQR